VRACTCGEPLSHLGEPCPALLAEARKLVPRVGTDLVPAGGVHPARRAQARAALASPKMQEILGSMADYVRGEVEDGDV
jgi:hypothetical protein